MQLLYFENELVEADLDQINVYEKNRIVTAAAYMKASATPD